MQHSGSIHASGRRWVWVRWVRVLIVGMVCGGIQIVLLMATGVELTPYYPGLPLRWPWLLVGALSACSYLVLCGFEGFLAISRKGTVAAGRAAGLVVGGISALTVAIPIVALVVIMLSAPPPTGGYDPNDLRPQLAFILCVLILLEGLWAWILSWLGGSLGGWIGGIVGQRTAPPAAPRSIQSGPTGASSPPPGEVLGGR